VLRQRAAKEEAAEQALALAHNEYNRRLRMLEDARLKLEGTLTVPGENELDIFAEMHLSFYRSVLSRKVIEGEEHVNEACRLVEGRRNEAVQARQERQVIEKLKNIHMQKYRREEAAREQKENDELALYTYYLRRAEQPH